jgi:hypothetical protein
MKIIMLIIVLGITITSYGQPDERITTIDFVQILNDNKEEAIYYYQNNWKILREMAIEKEYIKSYQILETPVSESESFQLMLITTYKNTIQYDLREDHFAKLIKEKGELKLMNDKKPMEFRKTLFNKEMVRHWD